MHVNASDFVDQSEMQKAKSLAVLPGNGIDLEFETDVKSISPDASQYKTIFVTSHKKPCRATVYHPKGKSSTNNGVCQEWGSLSKW